jgi:hypothetical protein
MKLSGQLLLVAIVPFIFVIGIVLFFILLPEELLTLTNFIGYMSSLSTTVMVLVYVVTTSRQLNTMSNQLKEMQYSRSVQVQPLPYLETRHASFELPRYYVGPSTDFKKMELRSYVKASFAILNHGNGPAIIVDFIAHLVSGPRGKKGEILDKDTVTPHVDCVPLKTRNPQEIDFELDDSSDGQHIVEALIKDHRIAISFIIIYKNALGKPFRENVAFWLNVKSEKDFEMLKSSLKLIRTVGIDFAAQLQKYEKLAIAGREDERIAVLEETNKKINDMFGVSKIDLEAEIAPSTFDVRSISEEEYQGLLALKSEIEEDVSKEIRRCWEKYGYYPL